jgi:hypothetical protein
MPEVLRAARCNVRSIIGEEMEIKRTLEVEEIIETVDLLKIRLKSANTEDYSSPEGAWNWVHIALPLTDRGKILVGQKVIMMVYTSPTPQALAIEETAETQ